MRKNCNLTKVTGLKIEKAKESGLHEPLSLHPVVDHDLCIGSGACITACTERDILGISNGQAVTINASRCVGHGSCYNACPVHAITLCIGTEKRGVDIPHVTNEFETNVPGIFIAGELGGMGLIKNAIEQGKQVVDIITAKIKKTINADYDLIIVGAGPAGIAASLTAKKNNLKFITLEQDSVGGTVYNYPRAKIVMTSPAELPLYGNIKLRETTKTELIKLWHHVLAKNKITINEQEKVAGVEKLDDYFRVSTTKAEYKTNKILLTIGRSGVPRKLGIPGEGKEKVFYRLLEPEIIEKQKIMIVGGGDSAVEAAMLLYENNEVTISYRGETFTRLKPKNLEKINNLVNDKKINAIFNSNLVEIKDDFVNITISNPDRTVRFENDLVYIYAGGELPTKFLEKMGIKIVTKFGEALLKH
jgi:thioredoxin reductase